MSAEAQKPWVKSWRGGSTKWRALPVFTRGLSRELETHANNEGRIELPPDEDPKSALWRLIGAHPRERQNLGKHLDVLAKNETIVIEPGLIYFPNWRKYQGVKHTESGAVEQPQPDGERNSNTTAAQPLHNSNTTAAQLEHNRGATAVAPNPSKSLERKSQEGEGEGDKEKEPPSPLPPVRVRDPLVPVAQRPDVVRLHKAWKHFCGFPNHRFRGAYDSDAGILAEALDTYGQRDCLLVAKHAPDDGMVNGKLDRVGAKHDSIRYIFGNQDAFNRILRSAHKREGMSAGKLSGIAAVEKARRL